MTMLRIDPKRLWDSLMTMARIGATPRGGCNRQALTDLDRQGRDLFVEWARAAGCEIHVDEVGNIFARRAGSDPDAAPVIAGSHLDTQETGGKFDGVYGVLAALEVVRTLADAGIETVHPIEIAVWTNEEGCRFAPAMLGSGVVSGVYDREFAFSRRDKEGLSFGDELRRIGYAGDMPAERRQVAAFYEAHIEQGPILEKEGITIGAVTGIQGAYWFDVTVRGASAHAGPTPMEMRRDPWRAVLPIVEGAFALADENAPWGRTTIGDIQARPGARNTVPRSITLTIDIRHPDHDTLEVMVARLKTLIEASAATADLEVAVDLTWYMPPTRFDADLVRNVAEAAKSCGYSYREIVSGAGHDSLHTAQFAPTCMIFVPCEGGISHNEAEAAKEADLAAGANVLLHAMMKSAGALL
ncbi:MULTISPECIES: Zn-dependent hydrolase [unclassified Sphingobium]|uniref:Zn-dependent hydrolase n=1 Tax=unclassified Sphingobium TaxID=2611147 RepID=UPI00222491A2|nr:MULTISPECIES: Zn-dependent hydrolase [unclassified Sphingobium]MCW2395762.1 N-carbamoyl-L-amino-acid hydrolase [Sphingobium sp. B8D3B]MCW2419277.1 N-carbamoyl-L-amino-acid hydrolase [Sphingobium sp. B8D3C]